MKQFNLEEYLKNPSKKVVTRIGQSVRIICTDAKYTYPVVALVRLGGEYGEGEMLETYTKDGTGYSGRQMSFDLFFASEKNEGWVNIYRNEVYNEAYCGKIYDSEEEAKSHANSATLATAKIEWEE